MSDGFFVVGLYQGSHRLEKYLNMTVFPERKSALKSAGIWLVRP